MKSLFLKLCVSAALTLGLSSYALSITVVTPPTVCQDVSKNHMSIDTSWANSCIDSGIGNINGNASNDPFMLAHPTWNFIEKSEGAGNPSALFDLSYTAGTGDSTSITGTWSLDSSFWDDYSTAALGFKFGTGNTADEWFVFDIINGTTSGDWTFFSVLMNGQGKGGLSHVSLYSTSLVQVSEPASVALLGLGLIGLAAVRRRSAK